MGFFDRMRERLRRWKRRGAQPVSVAGLDNDSPWVLVEVGKGVIQLMTKDAYDYIYGDLPDVTPSQNDLTEMLSSVTRVRVLAGGMVRGKAIGREELIDTANAVSIDTLRRALSITEAPHTFSHCACVGGPTLEFYVDQQLVATICVHHGRAIRWEKWKHDALLASPGLLQRWLTDNGVDPKVLQAIFSGDYRVDLPLTAPKSEGERHAQDLVRRGELQRQEGKFQTAIDLYDEALTIQPDLAVAHVLRGLARQSLDDDEGAVADCTRAIELGREDPLVYLARAKSRGQLGELESAVEDCTAAIDLAPEYAEAHSDRGLLHARLGRLAQAVKDCEEGVRLSPGAAEAHRNLGIVLLSRGDIESAVAQFDESLQLSPGDVGALYQRARALSLGGALDRAIDDLTRILEQDPMCVSAWIERAKAWERKGEQRKATADYDRAAEIVPERLSITKVRAWSRHGQGDHQGAIAMTSEALEGAPGDVDLYMIRATAHWYEGNLEDAISDFTQALIAGGARPDAYLGRGHTYAELEEYEAALSDLEDAVRMAREGGARELLAYALNGRGRALAGLGRLEDALPDFSESLRLCPQNAWAYFNRGLSYQWAKRHVEAAADFERALQYDRPPLLPRQREQAEDFLRRNVSARRS